MEGPLRRVQEEPGAEVMSGPQEPARSRPERELVGNELAGAVQRHEEGGSNFPLTRAGVYT